MFLFIFSYALPFVLFYVFVRIFPCSFCFSAAFCIVNDDDDDDDDDDDIVAK